MKGKIIGILVLILLIGTATQTIGTEDTSIEINNTKPVKLIENDCNCDNYADNIFSPRNKLDDFNKIDANQIIINSDLPEYFSWKDYEGEDYTTPSKNQMYPLPCGSCFIHAAIGTLESVIKIREECPGLDIDLSEQYVLSCLDGFTCTSGGFGYKVFKYINETTRFGNYCNGIIPEVCFPYQGIDKRGETFSDSGYPPVLCDHKCEDWEDFLIPIVDYEWVRFSDMEGEDIRNLIKTLLMEKGPLDIGISHSWDWHKWTWAHNDPEEYYEYPGPCDSGINHEVVIVGWKDDPSIGNGGYWICKNHYGTEYGYDGFFNIEYGSNLLDSEFSDVSWVDYDPESFNNWLPTVDMGEYYSGTIGEIIVFDASGCFDHEGDIISFDWDFGDETSGNGISPTHTYTQEGVYCVNLVIKDNDGNAANGSTCVFIDRINTAPDKPSISGETDGENGTVYDYTFLSIDPEGDDVYYFVYWGSFEWDGFEGWIGPYKSGEEIILNNTWTVNETYIIHAKSKDVYGEESNWATLEVKMPKSKTFSDFHPLIFRLIQRFSIIDYLL